MRSILLAIIVFVASFILSGCTSAEDISQSPGKMETSLPHSVKGYELYSWQVENEWHFTLITGTNRLKSYEEITSSEDVISDDDWTKVTVKGVDAIKAALGRLPEGEEVFWIGEKWLGQMGQTEMGNLSLPSQEIIDGIEAHCDQLGVKLRVDS
jgi:hypothetical protein